jgi:hypothetical protein
VASISGAGWGAWISWNCGIGRSLGGFTSLVQQQEAVTHAVAEMAIALRMRFMEFMVVDGEMEAGTRGGRRWKSFAGSDVSGLGGSRSARAAGCGGKGSHGGNQNDFHRVRAWFEVTTGAVR